MSMTVSKREKVVKGSVQLPASKSISNRLLIIRALCRDHFEIHNLSQANDTQLLQQILNDHPEVTDVQDAGTAMRFLTAFYANKQGMHILTGTDRMKQRPIGALVDALRQLGAEIDYLENEGYPPLKITGGNVQGGIVEMDASVSSQFITALLLVAPELQKGVEIHLTGKVASRPYIYMTLKLMEKFGIEYQWQDDVIHVAPQEYDAQEFTVEQDWSAASYFYSMASLADEPEIMLENLTYPSLQGDAILAEWMKMFGVATEFTAAGAILRKVGAGVHSIALDFSSYPDLAQTLISLAAARNTEGIFTGLESLRIKETDRINALQKELVPFGKTLEEEQDTFSLSGKFRKSKKVVKTYKDHRMAMAFAPLAIKTEKIRIENPQVVNKSFPAFWKELEKLGFECE